VAHVITTAEVDSLIFTAHWRYLHAVWIDNRVGEDNAKAEMDDLLEQRYAITRAVPQPAQ
jgi:hypothetical protein